jgi:glycosyltransferase involved in cell wall biosynthesis
VAERPRTVLIFAHECAPYNRPESTVGAQRPAQFAKHLPEFGWRAIVLCCDARMRRTMMRSDIGEVDALVERALRDSDPRRSVVIASPSLVHDGARDRLWRTMSSPSSNGRARTVVRKALTLSKLTSGDYSQSWQPCARRAATVVARSQTVDLCLGEHGPDAGIFLARWFARRHGVPWVADFRDPILQPFDPVARAVYTPVARRLLSSAACTITVNEPWARLDEALFGLPAHAISNGFAPEEFEGIEPPQFDRFTVAYPGNVIASQRMELFIEGLARLRERAPAEAAAFRFVYYGSARDRVSRMAIEAGVSEMVEARAHAPRPEALALMRGADALLLLSIASPESEDVYLRPGLHPAKAFEYFGARRPILCVPGDGGLLDELMAATSTGVILRTPERIAEYLEAAVRSWRGGVALPYAPDEQEVARYTRRNLTKRLAGVLDAVVAGAGRG